jgi:hypothetical protein
VSGDLPELVGAETNEPGGGPAVEHRPHGMTEAVWRCPQPRPTSDRGGGFWARGGDTAAPTYKYRAIRLSVLAAPAKRPPIYQ